VLVHESIPGTAVLASVPLLSLLEKLPSYFLRSEIPLGVKGGALAAVAWNYTERKSSYRQFCQDMSTRFLQLSPEARLQDITAGSLRLAISFLRPWFHQYVRDDFQTATVTLCALSFSIAQWPGQWWAQEHSEMWSLIQVMVLSLSEEVREKQRGQVSAEVSCLQGVITELEGTVKDYEEELSSRKIKKSAHILAPLTIPPPLRPAVMPISPSPFTLGPSFNFSLPRTQSIVPTPITPPTSPIRSAAPEFPIGESSSPVEQATIVPSPVLSFVLSDGPLTPLPPHGASHSPLRSDSGTFTDVELPDDCFTPKKGSLLLEQGSPIHSSTPILVPSPIDPTSLILPASPISPSLSRPPSPVDTLVELPSPNNSPSPVEVTLPLDLLAPHRYSMFEPTLPSPILDRTAAEERRRARRPPSVTETASCIVTGFLVGAFITLCLLSPYRRTILTNLT
jgi:hypothetical protein